MIPPQILKNLFIILVSQSGKSIIFFFMFSHVSKTFNAFLQRTLSSIYHLLPTVPLDTTNTLFTVYLPSLGLSTLQKDNHYIKCSPTSKSTTFNNAVSQNLSHHHHSQYQFHKRLAGLQSIYSNAAEEKNLVAPVRYQSNRFTVHNITAPTKLYGQSGQSSPHCPPVSKL